MWFSYYISFYARFDPIAQKLSKRKKEKRKKQVAEKITLNDWITKKIWVMKN